ncbi:hypothetical protein FOA52_007935 [Chlamydomonas sp. UWO 241]|nr:hypothetical protein FOA52_007935 [Chlamydomonas sp. UWO 241]
MAEDALRGSPSFSQSWLKLFQLFDSASGLKLRLNIADTIVLEGSSIVALFYTSLSGVVTRAQAHELGGAQLHRRLTQSHPNPDDYAAIAHHTSGVSRLLKPHELEEVLQATGGPFEANWEDGGSDGPSGIFCIQSYIVPIKDMRYISSFGGDDDLQAVTTFGRRFSARYTHAFDAPPPHPAGSGTAPPSPGAPSHPLTADEMVVERQLEALGLLEPCDSAAVCGESSSGSGNPSLLSPPPHDAAMSVPKAVKIEVQRCTGALVSFLERAHGLRARGMVAEFIQSGAASVTLLSVHAVQWDTRASRGRLGTFTDRWGDFVGGVGPPPTARVPGKRNFAPALLGSKASIDDEYALSPTSSPKGHGILGLGSPGALSGAAAGGSGGGSVHVFEARPGSAPTVIAQRFSPKGSPTGMRPSSQYQPSAANGHVSARNVASARRRGAGGNAVSNEASFTSYALWTPREMLSSDSVTGSLALENELLRERLQRKADVAARAEAALAKLAAGSKAQHQHLVDQIEQLRVDLTSARSSGFEYQQEFERLRIERVDMRTKMAEMTEELGATGKELEAARNTLFTAVRESQSKEGSLGGLVQSLGSENEALSAQVAALVRRVAEGEEVIDAVKSQLVDYRSMVTLLQSQTRRGKGKSVSAAPTAAGGIGSSFATPRPYDLGASFESAAGDDLNAMMASSGGGAAIGSMTPPAAASHSSRPTSAVVRRFTTSTRSNHAPPLKPSTPQRQPQPPVATSSSTPRTAESARVSQPGGSRSMSQPHSPAGAVQTSAPNSPMHPSRELDTSQQTMLSEIRKARIRAENGIVELEPSREFGQDVGTFEGAKAARAASMRQRETWRPCYDTVSVADLFISGGEILDRMVLVHKQVIAMLMMIEEDLLEMFNNYGRLKHVRMHDDKLAMSFPQFARLASDVGLRVDDPAVEDVWAAMSDRTVSLTDLENGSDGFIYFQNFPEAVARLGAARYEWKVPSDEDLDTMVEIPELLKESMAAAERAAAAALVPPASRSRPSSGRPWLPSPCSSPLQARAQAAHGAAAQADGSEAGATQYEPEQILLMIIHTFINHDLLPNARRGNTAGSVHTNQKARADERLTPADVWKK